MTCLSLSGLSVCQSQSFPSRRTGFKVGMKLEGVDPLHPSMFCVLTVAEVTHIPTHPHTPVGGQSGESPLSLSGDWQSTPSPHRWVLGVL